MVIFILSIMAQRHPTLIHSDKSPVVMEMIHAVRMVTESVLPMDWPAVQLPMLETLSSSLAAPRPRREITIPELMAVVSSRRTMALAITTSATVNQVLRLAASMSLKQISTIIPLIITQSCKAHVAIVLVG
jgi:hypothetical protein